MHVEQVLLSVEIDKALEFVMYFLQRDVEEISVAFREYSCAPT